MTEDFKDIVVQLREQITKDEWISFTTDKIMRKAASYIEDLRLENQKWKEIAHQQVKNHE